MECWEISKCNAVAQSQITEASGEIEVLVKCVSDLPTRNPAIQVEVNVWACTGCIHAAYMKFKSPYHFFFWRVNPAMAAPFNDELVLPPPPPGVDGVLGRLTCAPKIGAHP